MKSNLTIAYFGGQIFGIAAAGVALFWSAGRLDWWAGWSVLGVWAAWYAMVDSVVLRSSPGLMRERMSPPKGSKGWDATLVSILRLVELARYILAGLDQRYGWTVGFPVIAQGIAVLFCLLGAALFAWAMASNPFFSQVLRIQSERGHAVATSGPYRLVRHPGYAGMLVFELALSTLLGSWIAIALAGVCAFLLILRTALEDRTLQAELPGYREFAQKTQYRLLPGVW